jgi:L-iditol 2-dehydrogenase
MAYQDALAHLAPRGRLVVFSGLPASPPQPAVDLNSLHYLEQTVVGAYGCSLRHGVRALELISSGTVPVADLVSHVLPLSSLGMALDMVAGRRCMKIHLNPWE